MTEFEEEPYEVLEVATAQHSWKVSSNFYEWEISDTAINWVRKQPYEDIDYNVWSSPNPPKVKALVTSSRTVVPLNSVSYYKIETRFPVKKEKDA